MGVGLNHRDYRPDIDGLRALAVLAVVIFHAFPSSLRGGYIGVDVFFVISGYLISSIIFNKMSQGQLDFKDFYVRRIKRIFPVLILVTTMTLFLGWTLLLRDEFQQLGKHVAGSSLFISNFVLWNESGYFDKSTDMKPLLHFWSLAIEEQFYILWPIIIFLFSKTKRALCATLVLLFAGSFGFNIFNISSDPVGTFYSPLSRFWEICAGCLLAFASHHKYYQEKNYSQTQLNILSFCGLALICFALAVLDKEKLYPGAWGLLPVGGTVLLIAAGAKAWVNEKIFSNKFMIQVGLLSFSLYLWHWPLLAFARTVDGHKLSKATGISLVFISLVLAWLSYHWVEKPLRFSNKKKLVPLLLVSMFLCGLLGFGIFKVHFLSNTLMSEVLDPKIIKAKSDWDFPGTLVKTRLPNRKMNIHYNHLPPEVVFFGDSHLEQYGPYVTHLAKENKIKNAVFYTSAGCLPIRHISEKQHPYCQNFVEDFLSYIASHPTVKHIVIGACWNCYFVDEVSETRAKYNYSYQLEKNTYPFRGGTGKEQALLELKRLFSQLSEKYKVTLVLDNPSDSRFDPDLMMPEGMTRKEITFSTNRKKSAQIKSIQFERDADQILLEKEMTDLVKDLPVELILTGDIVCPNSQCASLDYLQRPIYKDKDHMRSSFVVEKLGIFDNILIRKE